MAKGSDLDVQSRGVPSAADCEELVQILLGEKEPVKTALDSAEVQKQIFEELLAAEDDDALENIGTSIPWATLEGLPVEIIGWNWQVSSVDDSKGGPPIFLVVEAIRMDTTDTVILTNGSWNVIAQIINLTQRGKIPGAIRMLEKGDETKSGGRPQRLVSTDRMKKDRIEEKIRENLGNS